MAALITTIVVQPWRSIIPTAWTASIVVTIIPVATISSSATAAATTKPVVATAIEITTASTVVEVALVGRWWTAVHSTSVIVSAEPGRWRRRAIPEVFIVPIVHMLHRMRPPNEVILEHVRMSWTSHIWSHVMGHVHWTHHWRTSG